MIRDCGLEKWRGRGRGGVGCRLAGWLAWPGLAWLGVGGYERGYERGYGKKVICLFSPPSQLAGWLAGWLAGRLAGGLAGWLAGWVAGWLAGWQDGRSSIEIRRIRTVVVLLQTS